MIAVIFEVTPAEGRKDDYFRYAAELKDKLETMDGFISVERFRALRTRKNFCRSRSGATRTRSPAGAGTPNIAPSRRSDAGRSSAIIVCGSPRWRGITACPNAAIRRQPTAAKSTTRRTEDDSV